MKPESLKVFGQGRVVGIQESFAELNDWKRMAANFATISISHDWRVNRNSDTMAGAWNSLRGETRGYRKRKGLKQYGYG